MAFQALLFCPDDKTARTVTQVLSELEFNVEPCTEPFAAVKKLMSDHFDALVVDCDNEQNATLLFKSARNSTSNQTSLAVAIVEGQAGVAKAFRIGANLVLTKPINVEQSKGTLRVARGLLRKGEPVKPGAQAPMAPAAPAATVPATPTPAKPAAPKPVAASPTTTKPPATLAAATAARRPVQAPPLKPTANNAAAQVAASSGLAEADEVLDIKGTDSTHAAPAAAVPPAPNKITPSAISAAKAPAAPSGFGSAAASAPAPAREIQVPHVEAAPVSAPHKEDSLEKPAEVSASSSTISAEVESTPAPSFTFGGANAAEESDDGRKKIFIGIAAAVLVAGLAYAGYSHFKGGASQPVSQASTAVPASTPTPSSTAPASSKPAAEKPMASAPVPTAQPVTQPADVNSQPATTSSDSDAAAEESTPTESKTTAKTSNLVPTTSKSAASAKSAAAPLVVKGGAVPKTKAATAAPDVPAPDTPAPNVIAMAPSTSSGVLSGLVGNGNAPKPVLQSVNISQGVSQGLLVKKVQPVYPKTALSMRVEGIVELMATISKTGDITNVKVLKGDPQLTRAAADAVKQWKYKPYLLNGEPVEITTQVTINFKLPN